VTMVQAGVRKAPLADFGIDLPCFLYDPDVAETALSRGITKSMAAMKKAMRLYPEGIFVIGNAPTAVFELCEQFDRGQCYPSLVVGIPIDLWALRNARRNLSPVIFPALQIGVPRAVLLWRQPLPMAYCFWPERRRVKHAC
jgi:precorrin-8X/cobalt-precorrin-8 methylmutase